MRTQSEHPYRVVTPVQKLQGYLELHGMVAERKQFEVIRKLDDGNFLVKEPSYAPSSNDKAKEEHL